MNVPTPYTRQMLSTYDKQLVTARRLARYRQIIKAAHGGTESTIAPEEKRRILVEKVSREIMENMLFAGSENAVIQEIKKRFTQELGDNIFFTYPPLELEIHVFKMENGQQIIINGPEKSKILDRLWRITLETVDDTML